MEKLGIDLNIIPAYIINFLILFFVLKHFLFGRIKEVMNQRREKIVSDIEDANKDKLQSQKLVEESRLGLKQAKDQGKDVVKTYKTKAEALYDEIVGDAKKEATTVLDRAKIEIEREKHKAEDEIKSQSINLAIIMASKALEDSIDEETHKKLIDDFIAKVGN